MLRNIIFDLGGVLLNLDYNRTSAAFHELGIQQFEAIYTPKNQSGLFDEFDKGFLSPDDFRIAIRCHLPNAVHDKEINTAWNAMLLDLPKERLDMLISLRKRYRLFLLSNTNLIHVDAFSAYLQREYGFADFSDYFEKWYYSCNIGMRKPDREIFEFVLNTNQLLAEETLFIDDSPQHIAGAKEIGIQTMLLKRGETVLDLVGGL
jgi:putative hydrolase of the HAD superfamily